jgi:putative oxidoreductase
LDGLERHKSRIYAALRIVTGFLFAFHGVQAVFGVYQVGFPPDFSLPLFSQGWFGAHIELWLGLLVMLGLWTRPAAFLCSGTMAVAYVQFHWKGALGAQLFPAVNGGEPAALYAFLFLYIAAHGSGSFALGRSGRNGGKHGI